MRFFKKLPAFLPTLSAFTLFLLFLSVTVGAEESQIPSENAEVMTDSAFIEMVQKACFDFFWNEANPNNGLIKDRDASYAPCSIASVGFGITAICIAIDHGWITRQQGAQRILATLRTFWEKPQGRDAQGMIGYKGFFYHFLDMNTATRTWNCELSSIDTALLLAGILFAKEYFSVEDADESTIRQLADSIYYRVDWEWMRNYNPNLTLGWSPENGFINAWWSGYNEAMIMNILALGSPTHPSPKTIWQAWTSGYSWQTHYGYSYVNFPPLFGHQYSHCWIDFRNIHDAYMKNKGITYFENSRRATLAQREYCIDNPGNFTGYGENIWGITACDGPAPNYYIARGAPPAQNDDGTIAPTAAGGSIVFTPEESMKALRYMYDTYQSKIWKNYGFRDAFNLKQNWWGSDVIGIDEGPIIIMMENYRNENVWKVFMQNEDIQRGLERAGFIAISGIMENMPPIAERFQVNQNYPNPFNSSTVITFYLPRISQVEISVFDNLGRTVTGFLDEIRPAGWQSITFKNDQLSSGVYFYRVSIGHSQIITRKMIVLN